jgi:transcriptional regulator with PAS, ATPase and Fis domain
MTRALDDVLNRLGPREAFECLAELLPEAAVFVVDGERNVVLWSTGAEGLLGFTREEAVGRLCLSSIRCRACTLGCGIAKHGTVTAHPLDLFRADEQWLPTRKYGRGFFDTDGAFIGGIEVLLPTGPPQAEEGKPNESLPLPSDVSEFHGLVSRDAAMLRAFQRIRNVAETDATVLVRGESGTGKELAARAVHAEGARAAERFVAVNCAALTPSLLESELFGHVRGAFTGAVKDRAGLFQQANGGTLFLDEVAELPLDVQSKLLRVLEERTLTPVGGSEEIHIDVRVIAATHRSLREEVEAGRFREDLMYRLRVVPLFLPPLRERRGDVELLLRYFVRHFNEGGPRHVRTISPDAMKALLDYDWPGNVRELRNTLEYAFAVGRGHEILREELPPEFLDEEKFVRSTRPTDGVSARDQSEQEQIREALQLARGAVGKAAERLGMSRATFWRKRKKYNL